MSFKKDFVWGAATASYQIEGAAYEDGKGANIWDDFCKIQGKVLNGDTGDVVSLDNKVHDPNRIDFLNRYLLQLKKAAEDGVDVAGYFQWSLMDNFEWANGYFDRFGLIYVDYETLERTPKDSFYWYSKVIKQNGENL